MSWPRLVLLIACSRSAASESGAAVQQTVAKAWTSTRQTLSDFEVGGVNLARWFGGDRRSDSAGVQPGSQTFELYEDFCIADQIRGDETWLDLIHYRRTLQRPSLSFYVDKVARKRWLPSRGIPQARQFLLAYAHELTESGQQEDEKREILQHLPADANYCVKPSHMSLSNGVWLVKHEEGGMRFSNDVREMKAGDLDAESLAEALAGNLHRQDSRGKALEHVRPGLVIEELFTDVRDENTPPTEFCFFTIWGRVWVAQWNFVKGDNRWNKGFVHRNGTNVDRSREDIPHWLDWPRLLEMAEHLGAHKDMLRVDIFVGVPSGTPRLQGATEQERLAAVQYVVNECAMHPTTDFPDGEVSEEGARLWIAGYKLGAYRLIPNSEVPSAFLERGSCSSDACSS